MNDKYPFSNNLNKEQQIIFVALLCEKMSVLYDFFTQKEGWGNASLYKLANKSLFAMALGEPHIPLTTLLTDVEALFPDLDDFSGDAAAYALDACTCLHEAIMYATDNDVSHVQNSITAVQDSLDLSIQIANDLDPNEPTMHAILDTHPLTLRERQRQQDVVASLSTMKNIAKADLEALRSIGYSEDIIDTNEIE